MSWIESWGGWEQLIQTETQTTPKSTEATLKDMLAKLEERDLKESARFRALTSQHEALIASLEAEAGM